MPRGSPSQRAAWAALAATAAVGLALVAAFALLPGRESAERGAAAIGGPFELVDQAGRARTDAGFRGRFMLVFFGYSHCPDICPATVAAMSRAVDALGERGDAVVPVFITIDPARDTVDRLAEWARNFHPRLVALTGPPARLAAAAEAYKVYAAEDPGAQETDAQGAGASGRPDHGYLMNHTSAVYLMGPDGRYLTHFSRGTPADEMAARIAKRL